MAALALHRTEVKDPGILKFLFSDKRMSIVFLGLRLWLGYQWISAAEHKLTDPKWMQTGEALKGFWLGALKTDPKPVIAFDWYRQFIQFMVNAQAYTWFAKVVAVGEALIGIALILGAFTAVAAFFGAFMNWNFIMAGAASTNGMLLVVAVVLVAGWKVAGYLGVDGIVLPYLASVPELFRRSQPRRPVYRPSPAE